MKLNNFEDRAKPRDLQKDLKTLQAVGCCRVLKKQQSEFYNLARENGLIIKTIYINGLMYAQVMREIKGDRDGN